MTISSETQAEILDSWIDVFHANEDSRSPLSSCSIAEERLECSFTSDDDIDIKRKKFCSNRRPQETKTDVIRERQERDGIDSPFKKAMTPTNSRISSSLNNEEQDMESIYERLYNDMRKLQIVDEIRDECSPPGKTIPLSQATALYDRSVAQRKEKAMKRLQEDNEINSRNDTPKKIIPLSRAVAMYERGIQARAEAEEKRNKMREALIAEEESTITPTKTISLSEADAVYKRGMIFKAKSAIKMNEESSLDGQQSTPSKKIPLSKATALYERAMRSKAEALNKREEELQREISESSNVKIPLSQATRIYERGVRQKIIQKIHTEIEIMKLSKPTMKIPLSQATSIYERGMRMKAEASRRRQEEEQMLSPSKTISLSQATAIYERGMRAKADAVRRRQEHAMDIV